MVDNSFTNSYMHFTSATSTRTPTTSRTKGAKAKKDKEKEQINDKGYNNNNNHNYNYSYNHYSSCYNQQQHQSQQKGKDKGKGPIRSYDASNNIKGKNNQEGDASNSKGKGKSTSMTSSYQVLDLWQARTSSRLVLVQLSEECPQHPTTATTITNSAVPASGRIRSADLLHASCLRRHRYVELPAAPTTTTPSDTISVKHYLLQHLYGPQLECPRRGLPSNTSVPPTLRTSAKESNHQASEDNFTSSTSTRKHLRDLPQGLLRRWGNTL